MTWPPQDVDFALAENAALTTVRQLAGIPLSWGEMISHAQAVMSYADDRAFGDLESLFDAHRASPIIAAARILDSASDERSRLDSDERLNSSVLAVLAFAMHGNFASAAAAAKRERLLALEPGAVTPAVAAALGTCLPNHIADFLRLVPQNGAEANLLGAYLAFLAAGDEERVADLRERLNSCLISLDPHDYFGGAVLRQARLALEQAILLSVPRVLKQHSPLAPEVLQRLVQRNYRVFLPPQYRAIVEKQLLRTNSNAMIALPTSTGKTVLGALCLLSALGDAPGLVCYVTPWVATARQAAESQQQLAPSHARVVRLMGGYNEQAALAPCEGGEVVVATPERFDALLRGSHELTDSLRAVVFDEAHLVENASRGVRLEGMIARLRMMQDRGHRARLVFTSAVLSPDAAVQRWLGVADESALIDNWRPTARRVARWAQSGRLEWFTGDDPVRRAGTEPTSVIGYADVPWPEPRINPTGSYAGILAQESLVRTNVAYLAEWLLRRLGWPILCVCATKARTREMAVEVASRLPLLEPIPPAIAAVRARLEDRYPFLAPLGRVLLHGVAFHNSTVPHDIRQLIEEAVGQREIRLVAATTTLAEGVDLPFRVTVIADWLLWGDAPDPRPISPALFANIAGRAGRAGSFTDGDTVLYDNPLGEPQFTHASRRAAVQRHFFLASTPPALLSAFEHSEQPDADELQAALASQFLAAIPENAGVDDLMQAFLAHTLVASRGNGRGRIVEDVLAAIGTDLVSNEHGAFAVAHSPLTLTPLGEAANRSGFSPQSVRRIVAVLDQEPPHFELPTVAASLLRQLGTLPEQSNEKVKQVLLRASSRFWVKPADFEQVITGWLAGTAIQEIFVELPIVGRSSIEPPIAEWLDGVEAPKWDKHFDSFVDFVSMVVVGFLPWLMRAIDTLAPIVGGWSVELPWRDWAERLEAPEVEEGSLT